jgi:hypothetical protein
MVGIDNKLNSDFRFLFNKFKNQIKNNLVKTEELLDYIINSTNIKYIKKFLSKKSYENPNLTNFDIIIKKIYKIPHNPIIIEKIQKIAFEIIYAFKFNANNQPINEQNMDKIKKLINRLRLLTYESYHNIVANSPNININNLYAHDELETIIGYIILLNYNTGNFKLFKWELFDASIGFIYQLKKYLKVQLKYFYILKGLYASYSDYYSKLMIHNYDINQTIKNIKYWFKYLNIDFIPTGEIDNWRIYYIIHSLIYTKNINIRRNILVYPEYINDNFSIVEIYMDYVLNFQNIPINNFWDATHTIIKEYEYMTIRNLKLLLSMNKYILKNIKSKNNNNDMISLEWKSSYHTLSCNIVHMMNKSIKDIQSYRLIVNLYYNDYAIYVINLEFINNIIMEMDNIIDIYMSLKFNNDQLSNIIVRLFKMYDTYKFERIFDNIYYFDSIWKHIIHSVKKKNKTDNQFIEYLCDKLIQNNFDYNNLEIYSRIMLPNNWIDMMDKFLNEDTLSDEFYDPFTNEIICEPLILPITGQITDKNVIYKILLNNPINPFNRLELSIKELEEYNMQPEIIQKLTDFKINLKAARQKTNSKN